jgi:hypothetical protein
MPMTSMALNRAPATPVRSFLTVGGEGASALAVRILC